MSNTVRYRSVDIDCRLTSRLSRYASWRAKPPSRKALDKMIKMSKTVEVDAGGSFLAIEIGGKRKERKDLTAGHVASYM